MLLLSMEKPGLVLTSSRNKSWEASNNILTVNMNSISFNTGNW
jgi:hypothetical protein